GGVQTDLDSRALGGDGNAIDGLYAAGEVAGFGGGGVHGYNALEGTFLGGCLFSGRQAGRAVLRRLGGSGSGSAQPVVEGAQRPVELLYQVDAVVRCPPLHAQPEGARDDGGQQVGVLAVAVADGLTQQVLERRVAGEVPAE